MENPYLGIDAVYPLESDMKLRRHVGEEGCYAALLGASRPDLNKLAKEVCEAAGVPWPLRRDVTSALVDTIARHADVERVTVTKILLRLQVRPRTTRRIVEVMAKLGIRP
jgi:hypothetical protein